MPKPKTKGTGNKGKGVAGRPKSSENSETEEEEARKYFREKQAEHRGQVLNFTKLTLILYSYFSHRSHQQCHGRNAIPLPLLALPWQVPVQSVQEQAGPQIPRQGRAHREGEEGKVGN